MESTPNPEKRASQQPLPGLSELSENFPNLRLSSRDLHWVPSDLGDLGKLEGQRLTQRTLCEVQWPRLPHALPLTLLGSPDLPPRDLLLLPGDSLEGAPSCNSASHRREGRPVFFCETVDTGPSAQASALQSLGNVGDLGKVVPTTSKVVH